ncbi:Rap family tetratricopeptide repeat protein [Alkalicoccobacillus murimartini]|uniref:Response regulator aspartate phosphatase B n=1 Tax=Alkalicoccobacillus murimartini TaxID=171685 RepID=A0ABT9YCA9_9BACI|nr:Rap family tetratricopeptide repeat protein [Alkalicoccobacillus murimartini]MDQ0205359.1 response regulator aspartate phosphatase B [Alkalicoccobacillus murimartini]
MTTVMLPGIIVGSKCAEWYGSMIASDSNRATILKSEVEDMIKVMEPDDKVIAYYSLLQFRYNVLIEEPDTQITHSNDTLEPYLTYMYYFMNGQNEFYAARYTSATKMYGMAEEYLEQVSDPYEQAEFYLRLADGYYRINQYLFASSYMEKAMDIFKTEKAYKNKVLNGYLLLAAIHTELGDFIKAEQKYQTALAESYDYPRIRALLLRGLGLNRLKQNKHHEAMFYFEEALVTGDHAETFFGMKSKGDIAFLHLRFGNLSTALPLLEEVEARSLEVNDVEYIARCRVYRNLYVHYNRELVESGLNLLIEHELYFDAGEIAEDLSSYYEENEDFISALKYMKLVTQMNTKQNTLGE